MRSRYRGAHRVNPDKARAYGEFVTQAVGRHDRQSLDANHAELIAHAERLGGWFVRVGPLDGWVWCPRMALYRPVEIKIPEREGLVHELTPQQKRFVRWCAEHNAPWWTWRTTADVERDLGARRGA